ncbi:MAG: hypothetical protein H6Q49_434 [Deltaproteobacteria bacterium]|nr:hypothetical protein [Deltaproteobacteria bacterium]
MKMNAKITISDLLAQHPRAASIFIKRKMLCVGCPSEAFHTLEDAARLYGFDLNDLTAAISKAIPKGKRQQRK